MVEYLEIDGAIGEGGGQVLRTALSLSVIEQIPIFIYNIRKRRKVSGLRPQHVSSVKAAAKICGAKVRGVEVGSEEVEFIPGRVAHQNLKIDVHTAGAVSLVLQTIVYPLGFAKGTSNIIIMGGTHVPWSPSYHYLIYQWLHYMERIGFSIKLSMQKAGFYPHGGGKINVKVKPIGTIKPLQLDERGRLEEINGISAVVNLPLTIAARQRQRVVAKLGAKYPLSDIRLKSLPALSKVKGTMILLLAKFSNSQACYFSLGEKGKPAERVADEVIAQMERFIATDGVIDEYLSDQLLIPLVYAKGKSFFRTPRITNHIVTNADVIQMMTGAKIIIRGMIGEEGIVEIFPKGHDK